MEPNIKKADYKKYSSKEMQKLFSLYEKNGYVHLGKIISSKFCNKLLKRTKDLMMGKITYKNMFFKLDDPKGNYYNIKHEDVKNEKFSGPSDRYKKIKDLEYDPLFLKFIKLDILKKFAIKYVGKNVASMRAMILNKTSKNSSILPFHQDVSNKWKMSHKPSFTTWVSLNGANKKNGCLKVIEGSHKLGIVGHGNNIDKSTEKKILKKKKVRYLIMNPGEAIIFSNYTIHGSGKNKTKKNRIAFTVCMMNSKTKNLKTHKTYPKIFGKNSLTYSKIGRLKSIPKKVYEI